MFKPAQNAQTAARRMTRILGVLLLLAVSQKLCAGPLDTPGGVVERFNETLIAVMKEAGELGYAGRYERMESAIRESHDLPTITRIIAGRHWSAFDDEQKATLTDTLSELSFATYAYQFDSYEGEKFEMLSQQFRGETGALVRCVLRGSGGKTTRFSYMLKRSGGRWRIVNIVVEGVSDLALKRVEYGRIIKDDGFHVLITKLKEKITLYEETAN